MAKGIIIDIGFESDIKDVINKIESELKSTDFDSALKLSDSFKKQADDVRKQLAKLKSDIDAALSGTSKGDLNKQVQGLNKAVGVLVNSFKEMVKTMPASQASNFVANLNEITSEMNELSGVCNNASKAIKDVEDVSGNNIQIVNKDQIKQQINELDNLLKILNKATNFEPDIKSNKNINGVVDEIIAAYKKYLDITEKIGDIEFNDTLSDSQKLIQTDKLTAEVYQVCQVIDELLYKFKELNGKESYVFDAKDFGKFSFSDIRNEMDSEIDSFLSYILKRKTEITQQISDLKGVTNTDVTNPVNEVNNQTKKDKITIPLDISTKADTLYKTALAIINQTQSRLEKNPLEVNVVLVSGYASRKNQEIFQQIRNDLNNVSDEEIKANLSGLINNLDSKFNNKLHMKFEVEGSEEASEQVKTLISNLQKQLSSADFTIYPDIEMTEEARSKLQGDIEALSKGVSVNIGFKDEAGEGTDAGSLKKEVKNVSDLRKCLDEVIDAIDNKTIAFQVEQQTVDGVVNREITSLQELIGWITTVEETVKELSNRFDSLSTSFKIDFDFGNGNIESITSGSNEKILTQLSSLKQIISSSVSSGMVIPTAQKNKILRDIKSIATQVDNIFKTGSIDTWSSKFLSSLTEISNKLKTLFGNNALTDMIEQWNYSDELMNKFYDDDHIKERAAVIADDGKIYGSGTYDQKTSTIFVSEIVNDLKKRGIIPKIGIHSHGTDRIVASSIPQGDGAIARGGDLGANYYDYKYEGLEKQLTVALNDIEVFDAKGFYDSNSSIDFNDDRIKNLIRDKKNEIISKFNKHFYQYFQEFVSQYGSGDGLNLKDNIYDSIFVSDVNEGKLKEAIFNNIDPKNLLENFYKQTKNNDTNNLEHMLSQAIKESFDHSKINYQELGFDTNNEVNAAYLSMIDDVKDNLQIILNKTFGIRDFDYKLHSQGGGARDLATFNFRQLTPLILKKALDGEEYANNYQDFMKAYSKEDFIKQNPLGLSSGSLSEIFNESSVTGFLGTLDKIVEDLREIKTLSASNDIANAFNVKIDEESLKNFTEEINRLIESIEKLPSMLTDTFSSFNNINSDGVSDIDKKIQELNTELKTTEEQIKQVEEQIKQLDSSMDGSTSKSNLKSSLLGTESSIVADSSIINENVINKNELEQQLAALKEKHGLLIKQIDLLKEQRKLSSQGQTNTNKGETNIKTDAFKAEGETVNSVVKEEITKLSELRDMLKQVTDAVNEKTNAFKAEGKLVGSITDDEISNLNPLKNLESSFNNFKKFYDNNDLESEAGSQAALSYYNAYKEALESKLNKKDIQKYTIGKTDDLFTGNYTNYKKGTGTLDLSGLNSEITKYKEIVDKFNQPEVISVINALTEAIEKLLAVGNTSENSAKILENLNKVINNLGGKNGEKKIENITKNLENFQKSIQTLDITDNGFVQALSSILEKGEELKTLGEVLKSSKKKIDSVDNAITDKKEDISAKISNQRDILQLDSEEWSWALTLLEQYKSGLQDIVKITRNINVDPTTGFNQISYQFEDSAGSMKIVGENGELLVDNTKIANLNKLYATLQSSANEYYNLQKKILDGDTSTKTQYDASAAYERMVQAEKDIFYWKEKGLIPSQEQLEIEQRIQALGENYKEQEQAAGLKNMYDTVLSTIERLTKKQEEVNNLKLKADGTDAFNESIKNAQDNVSLLIATIRSFKFEDFFSQNALNALGLNGKSFLFDNGDLDSLKWVINELPFTEEQMNKFNDALDRNTLIKEKNDAATKRERTDMANENYTMIEKSLERQYELEQKIMQLDRSGRTEEANRLNNQLVVEMRNCNALVEGYKTYADVVDDVYGNLEKLFSESRQRFELIDGKQIDSANQLLGNTIKEVTLLQSSLKRAFSGTDLDMNLFVDSLQNIFDNFQKLKNLNASGFISDDMMSEINKYFNSFQSSISSISLDKYKDKRLPEFTSQLKDAENQLELVKIALDKVESGEAFTDDDINNVKKFIEQIRNLDKAYNDAGNKFANVAGTQNLLGKISDVLNKNTAMPKKLKEDFSALSDEIKSFGNNLPADKLKEFGGRFKTLDAELKASGKTGLSYFDTIFQRAKSMSQSFISMYLSLYDIVRYVRSGITTITELDTALTEMRKVSDESVESLKNFQKVSFDIAGAVGTTAGQIQNSTADWMGEILVPLYGNI